MQARTRALSIVSLFALTIGMIGSPAYAQNEQPPLMPGADDRQTVTLPGAVSTVTAAEEEPAPETRTEVPLPTDQIIVRGLNERISSWKRSETDHAIIYSNGSESRLLKAAIELEQLHHLMSVIFGQQDAEAETEKLRITLIGNIDFMQSLRLTNWRAAEGPFSGPIQNQRYYDPRISGAVMAVSREDLYFSSGTGATAGQGNEFFAGSGGIGFGDSGSDDDGFGSGPDAGGFNDDPGPPDFIDDGGGDQERAWEQAMFAGYAQHYITTYLPSAYPRWYIDAIGALFSTVRINDKGDIEYGKTPPAFRGVYNNSDKIDIAALLTAGEAEEGSVWSSHHAWLVAHFFFLSPDTVIRKRQLAQYMGAIANGRTPQEAVTVFGDLKALQKELNTYGDKQTRFARVPSIDDEQIDPDIRSLGITEAALLSEQLQLDARLTLPPLAVAGTTPESKSQLQVNFDQAVALRDNWLAQLRENVPQLSGSTNAMLLLAEAEYKVGNFAASIDAANQVLAETPGDAGAISWKAMALTSQAADGPVGQRQERIKLARSLVLAANRSNPDALLPLVAYFRSFTDIGDAAPEAALLGMLKVIQTVPNAPEPRVLLAEELVRQSRNELAEVVLLPVVNGPWDSPERQRALQNQ